MPPALARRPALLPHQQELVSTHQRFLILIVSKYFRNGDRDDIIAEGNVGLCIAASKFDPSRGFTFRTYAFHWIRAMVLKFVMRMRGPVGFGWQRDDRKVFLGIGKALTAVGLHDSEAAAKFLDVPLDTFERMRKRLSRSDVYFDQPRPHFNGEAGDHYLDIPDPSDFAEDYAVQDERMHNRAQVHRALSALEPRDRNILRWRYLAPKPETLAEVGDRLGLSRERVRQLEARALGRMQREMVKLGNPVD
jgi:RNA polymerase sigma-32 factor